MACSLFSRYHPLRLIGCFSILACSYLQAENWPHWRGPQYNGISNEKLIPAGTQSVKFKTLWKAEAGIGFSSFSVVQNRVYTMGNKDNVDTISCFDAKTGEVIWQHSYPCELDPLYYEGGPGSTPTVFNGIVFTLSKKGHIFALKSDSGEVIWSRDLVKDYGFKLPEWSFAASPFIDGDHVLLNVGDCGVSLNLKDGKTHWRSNTDTAGYATPVPFGNGQVLMFRAKEVSALITETGKTLWDTEWESSRDVNAADPLVKGKQFLVSSATGTALYEASQDGENPPQQIWKTRMSSYFNPGVRVGDYVYGIDGTTHRPTKFVCIEWNTGKERWSEPGFGSGGLVVADDLLVICDKGEIIIARANPDEFELLGRETVLQGKCWTAPVVANGWIYARNAAGTVVCVEVTAE